MRRVDRRTIASPTDRPADQPTDTASYRGALSHLQSEIGSILAAEVQTFGYSFSILSPLFLLYRPFRFQSRTCDSLGNFVRPYVCRSISRSIGRSIGQSIEFDGEHVFVRLLECVRPCPTVRNDIVTIL